MRSRTRKLLLLAAASALPLAGCGTPSDPVAEETSATPVEQSAPTPRLVLSYDGGLLVLDADSLEEVADVPLDGFVRLNPAGDDRHVMVSETGGFRLLDTGSWSEAHGDHHHHYTADPVLTDLRFGAEKPGHVVVHDGWTTLFSDGTGQIDIVTTDELADDPVAATSHAPAAHHGVAVARADGSLVMSIGDEQGRTGLRILDRNRAEVARTDDCPGLHGEAAAAEGVLTFGCEDGLLVVRGDDITKVESADPYGRIGNQAGSERSSIVLGDYKSERDAELERPQRFSLIDTGTGELRLVDLPASYSFRSLDRGPNGEVVLLGTDGALHVYDPETAEPTRRTPVIDPWREPDAWQSPMPNLHVQDGTAYVTDPTGRRIVAIDVATGQRVAEAGLDQATIELTGVAG